MRFRDFESMYPNIHASRIPSTPTVLIALWLWYYWKLKLLPREDSLKIQTSWCYRHADSRGCLSGSTLLALARCNAPRPRRNVLRSIRIWGLRLDHAGIWRGWLKERLHWAERNKEIVGVLVRGNEAHLHRTFIGYDAASTEGFIWCKASQVKLELLEERSDLSFSILSQYEKKLKGTKKEGWLKLAGYVGDTEEVFGDVDPLLSVVMRSASFSGWHEEATYHTTPECSLSLTAHLPVIKIA